MKRNMLRASQVLIDLLVLAAAFFVAFWLRFGALPPLDLIGRALLVAPYVVILEYGTLWLFNVPRFSWRYIGLREATQVVKACVVYSGILVISRFLFVELQDLHPVFRHGIVPLGVTLGNAVGSVAGIVGVRVLRRILAERAEIRERIEPSSTRTRTILVGAGQAGVLVAKELVARPELGFDAVGFLDDDPVKLGSEIHGIRVVGKTDDLAVHAERLQAEQILITMANVPGSIVRRIQALAETAKISVKIIPGIYKIVGGEVNLSRIRDVAIEDLLRRDPVKLDQAALEGALTDKVVLVTGAGGSIGSELCRQIMSFKPRQIVLVEQAEFGLFEIHRELKRKFPKTQIEPVIADVTDVARMESVFARYRPSAVFHAAAHKHVPLMEWNPGEAVKNNVGGSKCVADASHKFGCAAFVMVSTDKAVNPTSVMGATKRAAELYVQTLAARSQTRFVTVRFGNVLGSAGSVVPIFRQQIANGGPVTVTHPDMERYFMTIPEACQLVLQAGSMGEGGEIFVLDMGKPVKIVDLARDLIRLSGLTEEEVPIEFTGCRPGEKLYEELSAESEKTTKTKHPKIFVGVQMELDHADLKQKVSELLESAAGGQTAVRDALLHLIPEYTGATEEATERASERPAGALRRVSV